VGSLTLASNLSPRSRIPVQVPFRRVSRNLLPKTEVKFIENINMANGFSTPKLSTKFVTQKVEHHYHDYAFEPDISPSDSSLCRFEGKAEYSFPVKLHYALSELAKDGQECIVSWQSHGRCFLVHNQERFVKETLPL
jgi:hypothetical protein